MFINTSQILIVKISTIVENKPGMAVETYHLDRRILNPETYFNSWTKTFFFCLIKYVHLQNFNTFK